MKDYKELFLLMERTVHKYIQYEKMPQEYGVDVLLSQSEIHTIDAVGGNPNINVTKLAKIRGVTKGAASQMIYKLVDKGLIEKSISPNSDTEVVLSLTEKGKVAYLEHKKIHQEMQGKWLKTLNDIPEDMQVYMVNFLKEFEQELDSKLKK